MEAAFQAHDQRGRALRSAVEEEAAVVEASAFNGREPDEYRWGFDFGKLDSVSGRIWFLPTHDWELQVSTGRRLLLTDTVPSLQDESRKNAVGALTLGGIRDVIKRYGFQAAIGADVTLYAVPAVFRATHGSRPVSFQLFFRLRPPASGMGRMWNMRMSQPMKPMADMPADPHQHMHMS